MRIVSRPFKIIGLTTKPISRETGLKVRGQHLTPMEKNIINHKQVMLM